MQISAKAVSHCSYRTHLRVLILDRASHGPAASGRHQFTYLLHQPLYVVTSDPQSSLAVHRHAVAQELALPRSRDRALLRIHAQLQGPLEMLMPLMTRSAAA
jgi:hypothetical protein